MVNTVPVAVAGTIPHPMVRLLVSFPIACFCGALVTDAAYFGSSDIEWADFSDWLLAVGIIFGVLAAIAAIVDHVRFRRVRPRPNAVLILGSILVLAAGFLNNLVHSRDAWTSVVPYGIGLSAVTVVLIVATLWLSARRPAVAPVYYAEARP